MLPLSEFLLPPRRRNRIPRDTAAAFSAIHLSEAAQRVAEHGRLDRQHARVLAHEQVQVRGRELRVRRDAREVGLQPLGRDEKEVGARLDHVGDLVRADVERRLAVERVDAPQVRRALRGLAEAPRALAHHGFHAAALAEALVAPPLAQAVLAAAQAA